MTIRYRGERPTTLFSLVSALAALPELPPVERARMAPELIEAAKGVLAGVRGEAMQEALDAGMTGVALAAELGINRSKVNDALAAHRATLAAKGPAKAFGVRPGSPLDECSP